ncbi:MAG TPA: flagellar basal body rod protein FlgG [Pseudogracilibacillus sp.]|nr:flagellar basal body rod protein FlgG [Pseudogracilibacillus sp.]
MLRSMYSGISGMKGFQQKLDVVGNNISNVNTTGFKKGRVTFQDLMSQTSRGAQAPTNARGGVNPMQVGLGSQVGSIDNTHGQGFRQSTDRPLDFAIEGNGMFVVHDGNTEFYTRAGNFYLDQDGTIVNADGYILQGEDGEIEIPLDAQSFSVDKDGVVNYVDTDGEPQVAGQIQLANFTNPEGLEKAGNNLYLASANSGNATIVNPNTEGAGEVVSNALEMSNVDLAEEFTEMITAQRGFQSNTKIITTSDEILQELVNLKR